MPIVSSKVRLRGELDYVHVGGNFSIPDYTWRHGNRLGGYERPSSRTV